MSRAIFDKSPVEPAHPVIVALHDDLVAIYRFIREKYQAKIDQQFDEVSRKIGFVVATTLPVDLEVRENGAIKSVAIGAKQMQGTLFEQIAGVLSSQDPIPPGPAGPVHAGTYRLYLLWYPALKLKFRTEWMEPAHLPTHWKEPAHPSTAWKEPAHPSTAWKEPAHPGVSDLATSLQSELASRFVGRVPGFGEPVHWFDPGYIIAAEEAVLIHAIDEVYPELRLVDRVTAARQSVSTLVRPEVKEPAHFRQLEKALESERGREIAAEVTAVLRRYGY